MGLADVKSSSVGSPDKIKRDQENGIGYLELMFGKDNDKLEDLHEEARNFVE